MASPSMTHGAAGNLIASTTLASGSPGAMQTFTFDASAKISLQFQAAWTAPAGATQLGVQVSWYRRVGSTPANDTQPVGQMTWPVTASTSGKGSLELPTGEWYVTFLNLDATRDLTSFSVTGDTIDGYV